jgi:predicted nuclease of restriction endonuclease-like RecB superfamily
MLTADLAISWRRGRSIEPRYINADDPKYLRAASDLIAIIHRHEGYRRAKLDEALEEYIGVGVDYKVLRGLIKLLLDRCVFEITDQPEPAQIRHILFFKAGSHHPTTEREAIRSRVIAETASELSCSPEAIIENLYGDLPENQKLIGFDPLSANELLDRYNLAQAQALLYRCLEMQLWIEPQDGAALRRLFDAIKAHRLIHTICGSPLTGYQIKLSGPMSLFHRSQKYGVQMALFLPALLEQRGWRMRAEIGLKTGGTAFFELSSDQNRLRPYLDSLSGTTYESQIAEKLISNWARLESRWSLEPSRAVIDLGDSAFIPDFVFHNTEGRQVYLEILGFWTPHYLSERLKQFERAGFGNFILVAPEQLRGSREVPARLPLNVILFKNSLDVRSIQSLLD